MTDKALIEADHIIRDHFHLIDAALASALSESVRKVAAEIGGAESADQIEEIEMAVLSRMRVWAGSKLGAG